MNYIFKIFIFIGIMSVLASSQDRVQLRGTVSDFQTGEPVVKCSVSVSQDQIILSDNTGKFSISLQPVDSLAVTFKGMGFHDTIVILKLTYY
jgi:hypothetical protein